MIRLVTLGGIDLRGPSGPLSGKIVQPRHLALLTLLARNPGAPLTREKAVGLLWPDVPERNARRRLSDALYAIRQELGREAVHSSAGRLRLDPGVVGSDVAEFEAALAEGKPEDGLELYGGPFLDGFHLGGGGAFDEWVEGERRALARHHRETLESLAERAEDGDDWAVAIRWWRRRAGVDPTNSRVAGRLIQALAVSGNVPRAVAHARAHEEALRRELDLPLPKELRALVASLIPEPSLEAPPGMSGPEDQGSGPPGSLVSPAASPSTVPPSPPTAAAGPDAPVPPSDVPQGETGGTGESGGTSPEGLRRWGVPRGRTVPWLALLAGVLAVGAAGLFWTGGGDGTAGNPGPRAGLHPSALDHYEQGNAYLARRFSQDAVRAAIGQFERATDLDPTLAPAWRKGIHARLWLAWVLDDAQEGEKAREDLARLMELDPSDPDVRMGRGWFLYYGERRYAEALREFEAAAGVRPNDPEILRVLAFLRQRMGRWEEGWSTMQRAMELAPRDAELAFTAGQTLRWIGRPADALEHYRIAFSLVPEDDVGFLLSNVEHAHLALGDTAAAREIRLKARAMGAGAWQGGRAELYGGDPGEAVRRIQELSAPTPSARMFRHDALADAHGRSGDREGRRLHADSLLELARSQAPAHMEGPRSQAAALAWVFVGLARIHRGETPAGLQAVERGLALEAPFDDALVGPFVGATAARAFVRTGELERALDLLARASRRPAVYSPWDLALDPEWEPLRHHPRWVDVVGAGAWSASSGDAGSRR